MKTILLAISNDLIREAYSEILINDGFQVIKTKNGREALEMTISQKPAVVMADTTLEEYGGLTLLTKIKENEAIKRIPVVIFSQYEGKQERDDAMNLEASDFIAVSSVPPREAINRVKILLGEQKSYRIPVSEEAPEIKSLMESMGIDSLICLKCGAKRDLVLIKDLSNGNKRFIVSFVCQNGCE